MHPPLSRLCLQRQGGMFPRIVILSIPPDFPMNCHPEYSAFLWRTSRGICLLFFFCACPSLPQFRPCSILQSSRLCSCAKRVRGLQVQLTSGPATSPPPPAARC